MNIQLKHFLYPQRLLEGSVPGLSRTNGSCSAGGTREEDTEIFVHIAGKPMQGGPTAAMLPLFWRRPGLTVEAYTSPFINAFNERMQVNHVPISDEELSALTAWIRPTPDTWDDAPTEFEPDSPCWPWSFFRRPAL